MTVLVAKADGTNEQFDPQKLRASLHRAGADGQAAETIAKEVEGELWDGITTGEIYARAFARLREHRRGVAARYSLKRAVLDFGPSGFPFESYIAELFKQEGYAAKVDQIIEGACVEHEVDVVLTKPGKTILVEAKFHNTAGFKTDLKTVLYVQARIEDIAAAQRAKGEEGIVEGMVVTNTKFTSKAVQYASCKGLGLVGWDHPHIGTLQERIEKAGLYPVTALTSLSAREKAALLAERIVLCNALPDAGEALRRAGVSGKKADTVLEEVGALCKPVTE